MTTMTMTLRTLIITKISLINPQNSPKLITILFDVLNPKIKSRTFHSMNSKTMTKISSSLNINLLVSLSKNRMNLTNRHNINRKPIKSNNHPTLPSIILYQSPDLTPIKNYPFPTSKIATSKPNLNTSLISIINSHIHVKKSSNLHQKK